MGRSTFDAVVSVFVTVHPHETSALLHSFFCFFFILSAYFVVLPLRDESAISLGLSNLPGLFVGSLVLTLIAVPFSSLIFSLPNLSKAKALFLIHRFFSVSLILFFILWHSSSAGYSKSTKTGSTPLTYPSKEEGKIHDQGSLTSSFGWDNHGWFYISVRIGLFLWVALLNLITISSTWARVIDVMDSESGSRLFGFIGAGATLGQLFGSLFAIGMAFVGPFLLLFAALLLELAAQTSRGITCDISHAEEQLSPIRKCDSNNENEADESQKTEHALRGSPKSSTSVKLPLWPIFEGLWLILSSTYLLHVSLFIWLSAVVSSFFYFQKVSVIATTVTSSLGRRKLFAQINSFIAVFILVGQLSLTIVVPNPDVRGRQEILELYLQDKPIADDVDIKAIARGTPGFNGADLANLVNVAAIKAAVEGADKVTSAQLEFAKDRIIMGTERKTMFISEDSKKLTAYHESGHAIVALNTEGAHPIHKATIMPRGSALGMVTQLPSSDETSISKKQLLARLDVCMGGRVAEELIFGQDYVTTGASSDLHTATELAQYMVSNCGMSDAIGPVHLKERPSSEMQSRIDAEVVKLLREAYDRVKALLKKHEKALHVLANALLEYETLSAEEIRRILLPYQEGQLPEQQGQEAAEGDFVLV